MKPNLMKPIKYLINLIQKVFNRISIQKRFIFFLLLFSLTPVLIIGVISNNSLKKVVKDKIVRYSLAELTQTVANIQLKLAEYETISLQLFVNNDFITTLENYADTSNGTSNSAIRKTVEACFNEYMTNSKDLFGFMFLCESGNKTSIITTRDFRKDYFGLSRSFKSTSSYRNILKADGRIIWSTAIKENRNNYIILGRLIRRLSNGEPLGVLAIIIDEDKIDQLVNLSIYNELNDSLNGVENYSMIINDNGEIVSSPFKDDIGKNVSQIIKEIIPLRPVLGKSFTSGENKINQGSFITKVNNKESLITYKAIGSKIGLSRKNGWYLINLAPTAFLYEERQTVLLMTIILCLVFGSLVFWLAFYWVNFIYNELKSRSCQ
jgi:hypothetical protein